jgi:hypothetical protein
MSGQPSSELLSQPLHPDSSYEKNEMSRVRAMDEKKRRERRQDFEREQEEREKYWHEHGLPKLSLLHLPAELLAEIAEHLDSASLRQLALVHSEIRACILPVQFRDVTIDDDEPGVSEPLMVCHRRTRSPNPIGLQDKALSPWWY